MGRRDIILGAAAGALSMTGWASRQGTVNGEDIAQVRYRTRQLDHLDFRIGGGAAPELAAIYLRQAKALLAADVPVRLRPALHAAVGDMAHTVGYMAFDRGDWNLARETWGFGLMCVENSGDDMHLWARLLSSTARQEIWLGRPEQALILVDRALTATDQITQTEVAMLWALRARCLAGMGHAQDVLTAIGRSEDHLVDGPPHDPDGWMGLYDDGVHFGNCGHALHDLVAGRPAQGVDPQPELARLAGVYLAEGMQSGYSRPRVLSMINAASVCMTAGDPAEAVVIADEAVRKSVSLASTRANDMLQHLHAASDKHRGRDDVRDLQERIRSTIAA